MKNEYRIEGDVAVIKAKDKHIFYEVLIDTEDLERIIALNATWRCFYPNKNTRIPYVKSNITVDGKPKTLLLHRFIVNAKTGTVVDHIDNNPLNNRKSNLRIVSRMANAQNRSISNRNKSGITGVCYLSDINKWQASFMYNKKIVFKKVFGTQEEAAIALSEFKNQFLSMEMSKSEKNLQMLKDLIVGNEEAMLRKIDLMQRQIDALREETIQFFSSIKSLF